MVTDQTSLSTMLKLRTATQLSTPPLLIPRKIKPSHTPSLRKPCPEEPQGHKPSFYYHWSRHHTPLRHDYTLYDILCLVQHPPLKVDQAMSRFQKHNSSQECNIPKSEFDSDIMGYAIISFGFGELYILIARVWRLLRYREICAPLLSRSKWELDATSWVYGVAMICALIPFVVGNTFETPELHLYSRGFLIAFLGVLMLITLIRSDKDAIRDQLSCERHAVTTFYLLRC